MLALVNLLPEVIQPESHTTLNQRCRHKDLSIQIDGTCSRRRKQSSRCANCKLLQRALWLRCASLKNGESKSAMHWQSWHGAAAPGLSAASLFSCLAEQGADGGRGEGEAAGESLELCLLCSGVVKPLGAIGTVLRVQSLSHVWKLPSCVSPLYHLCCHEDVHMCTHAAQLCQ